MEWYIKYNVKHVGRVRLMLVKPSTPSMNAFTGLMDTSTNGSALLEHLAQEISPNCEFNSDNIKILDSRSNDLKLRYVENIHLKYSKQTLNTQERSIPLMVV